MTAAAIKATYSDYRRVKGRKVLQLIFEVPIEQAPEVHKTFGEPAPDGSMWVAIAKLNEIPSPGRSVAHTEGDKSRDDRNRADAGLVTAGETAPKPKRSWDQLSRAEQAGIACQDDAFRDFIVRSRNWPPDVGNETVDVVKHLCGVSSRKLFDEIPEAGRRWDKLYSDYQLWKRGAVA